MRKALNSDRAGGYEPVSTVGPRIPICFVVRMRIAGNLPKLYFKLLSSISDKPYYVMQELIAIGRGCGVTHRRGLLVDLILDNGGTLECGPWSAATVRFDPVFDVVQANLLT